MPDAGEQLKAVLGAPIPFFFALLVVAGAIWGAMEWAYRAVMNKRKELHELLTADAQLAAQAASRREAELRGTIAKLTEQIESLRKQKDQFSAPVQLVIDGMTGTVLTASSQVIELGKANTALSKALERQGGPIFRGEGRLTIDEAGISVVPGKKD